MRKCFNRYNRPLVNMIHTAEKIKHRSVKQRQDLDRMMDKIDLDRNFKLKEKMELLWANDNEVNEQEQLESIKSSDNLNVLETNGDYTTCPTPDISQPDKAE